MFECSPIRLRGNAARIAAAALTAMALTAGPAQAAPVTFAYDAVVNSVTAGDPAFAPFLGETIHLEYTFDSAAPDANASASYGSYLAASMSVSVGSYSATGINGLILVQPTGGSYYTVSFSGASNLTGPDLGGKPLHSVSLSLQNGNVFADDSLPLVQPSPADFSAAFISLSFFLDTGGPGGPGQTRIIFGNGTSTVTIAEVGAPAVPEPGTLAVFGLGLAGLGLLQRRKAR